jgi:hypothetical protein
MNAYIKLSTMEYPRYEGDIRLEYPEILETQTGDTFPCPADYVPVTALPYPNIDPSVQTAYQIFPQQIDGKWTMVWEVRDITEAELQQKAKDRMSFPQM